MPKTGMSSVSVGMIVLISACSITNDKNVVVAIATFPSAIAMINASFLNAND